MKRMKTNETNHTPGPWKACGSAIYTEGKVSHWLRPRDPRQRLVANCRDNEDDDPENVADNPPGLMEAEANARLIAAAPELLEALEAVLYSAEAMRDELEWGSGFSSAPDSMAKARAAIAKARGTEGGAL